MRSTNDKQQNSHIKDLIYCPITRRIMSDPVVTALGDTFEREAIEEWLRSRDTNPTTGESLPNKHLSFNKTVKQMVDVFLETNPSYQLNMDERYVPRKLVQKLKESFSDVSQLNHLLNTQPYLQLHTEYECAPIMSKPTNVPNYGNILHMLTETDVPNTPSLATLLHSIDQIVKNNKESLPSISNLKDDIIFGKNMKGMQPVHVCCLFNENENLFRELIQLQDTYGKEYSSSPVPLVDIDLNLKKNLFLIMFKLIITASPSTCLDEAHPESVINMKCIDFMFDKMGLTSDQLSRITHHGISIINYACKYNRLIFVKKMIERAQIDANLHVDSFFHNPLTSAVLGGAFDVVRYLVEELHVDIEARECEPPHMRVDFPSALHLAVTRGFFDIAQYLVSKGANLYATCKMAASSIDPADYAITRALFGTKTFDFSSLLQNPSILLSTSTAPQDRDEVHNIMTLSLLICSEKNEKTCRRAMDFISEIMITNGYVPSFPTSGEPLWFAIRSIASRTDCEGLFDWFLSQFYSEGSKIFNMKDKFRNNALHWLAAFGTSETMESLILLLSETEMDVHTLMNQKNHNGDTPLHIASLLGRKDICKLLIDLGADVRIRNSKLQDPLSAGFVCSLVATMSVQNKMALLKDLRKCIENRESGKTILTMQAKIRMLERKLMEQHVQSPIIEP